MRAAVIRVCVDPGGNLSPAEYARGVREMRARGLDVVHTAPEHLPDRNREIELIVEDAGPEQRADLVHLCHQVFETSCSLGVVTYISRGTDDDARGILSGFGLGGDVVRSLPDGQELVTVTVDKTDLRRVPESRLHTAMESALNCEVRIVAV